MLTSQSLAVISNTIVVLISDITGINVLAINRKISNIAVLFILDWVTLKNFFVSGNWEKMWVGRQ
jgi:hypothetical protein